MYNTAEQTKMDTIMEPLHKQRLQKNTQCDYRQVIKLKSFKWTWPSHSQQHEAANIGQIQPLMPEF